jgi:hypothetical protein
MSALQFLPTYRVLLYTLCVKPHCVPFNSLAEHFRVFHPELSKEQHAELVKGGKVFEEQLADPKDVVEPDVEL